MPKEGRAQFLKPLQHSSEARKFIVFDIESKHDDTQKAGFTRPFAVGVYDGNEYRSFRNDEKVNSLPWFERATATGGCLDKFLRYVFGEIGAGRYIHRYKNIDIYAHNMGAFDGLFLPSWLVSHHRDYSFKIMPVQGRIQMMEIWRHNRNRPRRTPEEQKDADKKDRSSSGTWRFLDSFRIMPASLDKLAKAFGFGGKVEHDLNLHEDDPHWEEYLEGDCVKLYGVLQKFYTLIDEMGGEVGMTAPSTAMKLLRRRYLREDEPIDRNLHLPDCIYSPLNADTKESEEDLKKKRKKKSREAEEGCEGCAHTFFRSAYFGGRTEVFQRQGHGWYYDINSSYPYSMKNTMPIGEMVALGENEDFTRYVKMDTHIGFIRCTVEIPEDCYLPPLPVQHGGKLKFPAGRFSGTWNWLELQVLKKIGGKLLHVEKSVWVRGKRFLADFVDNLYAFRDKKLPGYDEAKSSVAKIMLNSTFGKFGMEHDRKEMLIIKPHETEPYSARYPGESTAQWEKRMDLMKKSKWPPTKTKKVKDEGGQWNTIEIPGASAIYEHESPVRVRDVHVDAPYIIPQIAAHITASSRMLLWHYAQQILEAGYQIFYSDTDSIISDCPDIPDSTKLGGLKREYNGEKVFVHCYGPKMYYMRKETVFKGEHQRYGADREYKVKCLETCPGCATDKNGKIVQGEHIMKNGKRMCEKKCQGCADFKIMMKGFPAPLRTPEVIERLKGKETVTFDNQERLGALARGGFKSTPRMIEVKKSIKSEYDKRMWAEDGINTKPIVLNDLESLSERFKEVALSRKYRPPAWLDSVLPDVPVHPRA